MTKQRTQIKDKNGKVTHVWKNPDGELPVSVGRISKLTQVKNPDNKRQNDYFQPAKAGAVGLYRDGDEWRFYFYNDPAPAELGLEGGYIDDVLEFEADSISGVRAEVEQRIVALETLFADKDEVASFSDETQYMQKINYNHLVALRDQLGESGGLESIKKRGDAHELAAERIFDDFHDLEHEWDLTPAFIEKVYAYGIALHEADPTGTETDFSVGLWQTMQANEPNLVDPDLPYSEDLMEIWYVVERAMHAKGFKR